MKILQDVEHIIPNFNEGDYLNNIFIITWQSGRLNYLSYCIKMNVDGTFKFKGTYRFRNDNYTKQYRKPVIWSDSSNQNHHSIMQLMHSWECSLRDLHASDDQTYQFVIIENMLELTEILDSHDLLDIKELILSDTNCKLSD